MCVCMCTQTQPAYWTHLGALKVLMPAHQPPSCLCSNCLRASLASGFFKAPQMILIYSQDWNQRGETTRFHALVCALKIFNEQRFEYISSCRLISNSLVFLPWKTTIYVGKMDPAFVGGIIKWFSHFEKVWPFLKMLPINLPYDPEIPLLVYTEKKWKNRPCKDLYATVHSIHQNSQRITQTSVNWWMHKHNVVYLCN